MKRQSIEDNERLSSGIGRSGQKEGAPRSTVPIVWTGDIAKVEYIVCRERPQNAHEKVLKMKRWNRGGDETRRGAGRTLTTGRRERLNRVEEKECSKEFPIGYTRREVNFLQKLSECTSLYYRFLKRA